MDRLPSQAGQHLSIWTVGEFIGVLEDLRRLNGDILLTDEMSLKEISYSRKKLLESKMRDPHNLATSLQNRNLG